MTATRGRDQAFAELTALSARGIGIDAYDLLPAHRDTVERAIAAFGNLGAARDAASLNRRTRVGEDSDVVDLLRRLAERDVRLTPRDLRRVGEEQLLKQCYARFGSWPAAREAAGLVAPRRGAEIPPREHVLDALRGRAGAARVLAARDVDRQLARAARHYYGTVSRALAVAGISQPRPNARWTAESLLDELTARVANGRSISVSALLEEGRSDLASAVQRHLGSIRVARRRVMDRLAAGDMAQPARGLRRRAAISSIDRLVDGFVRSVFTAAQRRALDEARAELGLEGLAEEESDVDV